MPIDALHRNRKMLRLRQTNIPTTYQLTMQEIPGVQKKTEPELFALDPLKTVENQLNKLHSHLWSMTFVLLKVEVNTKIFTI